MRIVLFASGDFAVPTLRSLTDPRHQGHEIVALVTQPDRGSGRGKKLHATPAKEQACELGLPVHATADVNGAECLDRVRAWDADLGLAIAFGQKVNAEARSIFRHGCVNLHASLLPKYRGAAPFQWAIVNGEERTGVTVFQLVDRMDAGPIYTTRSTLIKPEERACELHDRLAQIGVDAVRATLGIFEADPGFEPAAQDEALATRAPKLKKEDGYIRFDQPARELANRINGLWDWPGAKCRFMSSATGKTETVTLAMARADCAGEGSAVPGEVDYRRFVATADGHLEVLEIKPDGARTMTFADFVNGRRVQAGDRFIPLMDE